MVMMIARTGREKQRYENGCRLIAGCVPYKLSEYKSDGSCVESRLQILVVKAQKSEKVLLPKGGWENDETVEEAALREAMEEAGVDGKMGNKLGVWTFSSKGHEGGDHVAHMFPLEVSKLLDAWPEEHLRERLWMSADGARNHFKHQWMREALDKLINVLSATYEQKPLLRSTMAVDKVSANSEQKVQIQFTKTVDKLTNEATCQQKSQPRSSKLHQSVLLIKILEPTSCTSEREQSTCGLLPDSLDSSCSLPRKGNILSPAEWVRYPVYMEIKSQNGATVLGPTLPTSELILSSPNAFVCSVDWWESDDPARKSRARSLL
ncbi:unnamed protein product [Victoria cruziana]